MVRPGMEYMQSSSSNSGSMNLRVTFNVGTNPQIAALNVQNRVGIAAPLLPSVVSKLGATVRASNPDQLMLVAIYSPKKTHNITFLDIRRWKHGLEDACLLPRNRLTPSKIVGPRGWAVSGGSRGCARQVSDMGGGS